MFYVARPAAYSEGRRPRAGQARAGQGRAGQGSVALSDSLRAARNSRVCEGTTSKPRGIADRSQVQGVYTHGLRMKLYSGLRVGHFVGLCNALLLCNVEDYVDFCSTQEGGVVEENFKK